MHALPELDAVTGYARLRDAIAAAGQLIVAYSGGVDSALLAYAAHDVLGDKAVAVTAVSASLSVTERRAARAFAQEHGIAHVEVATRPGANFAAKPITREYSVGPRVRIARPTHPQSGGLRLSAGRRLLDVGVRLR